MRRERRFLLTAGLSYAFVIVALALPSAFAVHHAFVADDRRDRALVDFEHDVARADRLPTTAARGAASARAYLLTGDRAFLTEMEQARQQLDAELGGLREQPHSREDAALLARATTAAAAYDAAVDRVAALRQRGESRGPRELAASFEEDMVPRHRDLVAAIDTYIAARRAAVGPVEREAHEAFQRATWLSGFAFAAAVLLSGGIGLLFTRMLSRAYERERDAIAVRDEVIGIVAHDLRSPLAAVLMKAALLRRVSDREAIERHAGAIERIALRMDQMIAVLLDAAGIQAGGFTVNPAPTDARALLDDALDIFGGQAAAKSVDLDVQMDAPTLPVMADVDRVEQALGNLVANAVKFTPSGGRIVLSAEPSGAWIRFAVRDNGPGIAPEDARHVFERFWKKERGGRRGSGLGLYIAKGIVEAHGGRIWVESEQGRGTCFCFELRRADATRAPAPLGDTDAPGACA